MLWMARRSDSSHRSEVLPGSKWIIRFALTISLLSAIFASISIEATTFAPVPFPDVVEDAPVIIRGQIGMSYANWATSRAGRNQIFTFTELAVSEVLKGSVDGSSVMMREQGGEVDGVGMKVAGTAKFRRGEEVVVMLTTGNDDGSHTVMGMKMGKYNIESDADGTEYLSGGALSPIFQKMDFSKGEEEAKPKRWSLADLKGLIKKQGSGGSDHSETNEANHNSKRENVSANTKSEDAQQGTETAAPTQRENQNESSDEREIASKPGSGEDSGGGPGPWPWISLLIVVLFIGFQLARKHRDEI